MNYSGIDVANKASAVCIIDGRDRILTQALVATQEEALRKALSGHGRLRVVIEASPLAEWVAQVVESAGHEAVIIDPRAAKHLVSSKKKTDARDAHTLAQLSRSGWYTAVHRKSPEARAERSRLQARQALVKVLRATGASVRGLLRAHGVRLGEVSEGQFAERVQAVTAREVPQLTEAMARLLAVWGEARAGAAALEKTTVRASRTDAVRRRMQSTPGVGPLVSTVFQATIDDPHRFGSGEEVADYVGLAPRVYQSGDTEYRGRITKEGDGLLRWHLVEAAHVLLTKGQDCALKRWGLKLQARKGSAKAKVAVARKLAILLWRLWVKGETFNPWPKGAKAA
jgi:transposase